MIIIIVMIMAMSEITGIKNKYKAFIAAARVAFPFTIPIMAGYVFAGIAFGMLMNHAGFPVWLTIVMCATMISGSGQFLAVDLLQAPFNPLSTLFLIFMVNSRYTFFGLTLLDKFRGLGAVKPYLIYVITDETFVVNVTYKERVDIITKYFMLAVDVMSHSYWIIGGTLGALVGEMIKFNMTGIDFAMTGMFTCIFLDQWRNSTDHKPALLGVFVAIICLLIFGQQSFMLPAMIIVLIVLVLLSNHRKLGEEK
jgi:4-azaleucine resistance transporter AzlC